MENNDTMKLLRECDAGSKMAVSAIDSLLDKASAAPLKTLLAESKRQHTALGNRLHSLLEENGCDDKEPNPMAKGMSWLKTNVKLGVDESDSTVADLITDGCNMGIKSLYRYLNQYKNAQPESKSICKELIAIEERLRDGLTQYL